MSSTTVKSLIRFCDLTPTTLDWLWPGRLPLGKLVLLDGDPDQGKSLLTLDWAARLTTGRPWPDGPPISQPEPVVLLAGEDNLLDTVSHRLQAAGADLSRIHVLRVGPDAQGHFRAPQFPEEANLLRETLVETNARLVIADPIVNYLSGDAGLNAPRCAEP
jgi:RecA-family ATPase